MEHSLGQLARTVRKCLKSKIQQGEIILRKPWMRVVFIAGLVGCVLLALGIRIAAGP